MPIPAHLKRAKATKRSRPPKQLARICNECGRNYVRLTNGSLECDCDRFERRIAHLEEQKNRKALSPENRNRRWQCDNCLAMYGAQHVFWYGLTCRACGEDLFERKS